MNQFSLIIQHLTVNYDKICVIWDLSLSIPPGVLVGILGPNGAGKSTLIKAVLDLVKPLSGKVEFFGEPLTKARQRIAYVPQRETVDWNFPITVRELVAMGRYGRLKLFQRLRQADWAAADYYLTLLGMDGFAHRQISQLSGGQQQRVFLARALLQEADIYFMDEPFVGVDATTECFIMDLLKDLRNKGKTIFVVQHDLSNIRNTFDWVILLNMRLVTCGPVNEVLTPSHVAQTFGRNDALFNEVFQISKQREQGV